MNADTSEDAAEKYGVDAIPALRIRTPEDEPIASHDGTMTAAELVAWLGKYYDEARAVPDEVLLESGEPDAEAVTRLVERLGCRNAATREAAARRLLPYPAATRPAVAAAFGKGKLATRLGALEVLRQWRAPVGDMDPWRPETMTAARVAALEKWSRRAVAAPDKPSAEQLAAADREIERMLKADDAEAEAIRQRLAGLGKALTPKVTARLRQAATDQDRQRLGTLRYRLVASDRLTLQWPGGLARLASIDPRTRQAAAEELASLATNVDRLLLAELFRDPDPLVREISLRGPATRRRQGGRRRHGRSALRSGTERPRGRAQATRGEPRSGHDRQGDRLSRPREGRRPGGPRHPRAPRGRRRTWRPKAAGRCSGPSWRC